MTATFNLTTQQWIPILMRDGTTRDVSLRELFTIAPDAERLACELPTQDFAVLRVLLAILHRAIDGPRDVDDWADLWESNALPLPAINAYLDQWAHRFDLLDPVLPFFQVPDMTTRRLDDGEPDAGAGSVRKIVIDIPDRELTASMRRFEGLDALTFPDAARWLIHTHAFDTAGIKHGALGHPELTGGKVMPQGPAWAARLGPVHLTGRTLWETLLLNLTGDAPGYDSARDLPPWERPQGTTHPDGTKEAPRPVTGKVDVFTWQSRRVRLVHDGNSVVAVVLTYGDRFSGLDMHNNEPMTAWKRTKEGHYRPLQHQPGRALWRGLQSLLPYAPTDQQFIAPGVVQHLAALSEAGILPDGHKVALTSCAIGFDTKGSKVQSLTSDTIEVPAAILADAGLSTVVVSAVQHAESAAGRVGTFGLNLARATGYSQPSGVRDFDTPAFDQSRERAYAALAEPFGRWIDTLSPGTDPYMALDEWHTTARVALSAVGAELARRAPTTATVGRLFHAPATDKRGTRWMCIAVATDEFTTGLRWALPTSTDPVRPERTAV